MGDLGVEGDKQIPGEQGLNHLADLSRAVSAGAVRADLRTERGAVGVCQRGHGFENIVFTGLMTGEIPLFHAKPRI
ncbi:hypothetical protein D3C79_1097370 [compost metagenome]